MLGIKHVGCAYRKIISDGVVFCGSTRNRVTECYYSEVYYSFPVAAHLKCFILFIPITMTFFCYLMNGILVFLFIFSLMSVKQVSSF